MGSLIPGGVANALGVSEGGRAAWVLAPQQPGGSGNTLNFTLYSFNPASGAWTQHTATFDTAGRLPSGVTAANIRSGGIVAGAVDPHSGNFFWAYLANAPTDAMTIFGYNSATNQPIGIVANSNLPQTVPTSVEVDKTGSLDAGANHVVNVGDVIHYTITVRNSGNTTLRNVTVSEQQSLAALSAIDCGGGSDVVATLAVGGSVECTATHTVTQADIAAGFVPNFAVATATPEPGRGAGVADVEDGDNDVEPIPAAIALRKSASPAVSAPGFRLRARTVCRSLGTLRPGSRRTLAFTARAGSRAPRRITNTATASARNARTVHARARVSIVGARAPRVTG